MPERRCPSTLPPFLAQASPPPPEAATRVQRRLRAATAAATTLLVAALLLHDWGPRATVLSPVRPAVRRALNAVYGVEARDEEGARRRE